jgi:peptide deformylase
MILPIIAYGDPVLKKKAQDITADYPNLKGIIDDMYETMYGAKGVGLAAPQIGLSINLFIIDTSPFVTDKEYDNIKEELADFKRIFINAQLIQEEEALWKFNEGCLSIPTIREDVERRSLIRIKYSDENFLPHQETFTGIKARIIQHEYDHVKGILFIDKINPLRKRLLKRKLTDIAKGEVEVNYKMKFFLKK